MARWEPRHAPRKPWGGSTSPGERRGPATVSLARRRVPARFRAAIWDRPEARTSSGSDRSSKLWNCSLLQKERLGQVRRVDQKCIFGGPPPPNWIATRCGVTSYEKRGGEVGRWCIFKTSVAADWWLCGSPYIYTLVKLYHSSFLHPLTLLGRGGLGGGVDIYTFFAHTIAG